MYFPYCVVWCLSLGLPRVSVASIDQDILTTLAIHMTLRGQVDLLISILRSEHRTMDSNKTTTTTTTTTTHSSSMNKETTSTHPWDKLWLQVAQHMCARNGETEKRCTHHDRDLLSLLMRLSVEEDHTEDGFPFNVSSQIERASQIDPLSQIEPSQISLRTTATLISRSGLLAMVHLTIQTMIKRGETQRAEQLAKAWKV